MSDESTNPAIHPEEHLAAYVDGSASAEERSLVERHILVCSACRSDVRLAKTARDALRGLPTLEPPGIAAALRLPEEISGEVVSLDERRSRTRWQRVSIALGAAAAASVVVAALVLHLGTGGSRSPLQSKAGAPEAQPAAGGPATGGVANYTAQSLAALAGRLRSNDVLYGSQRDLTAPTSSPAATRTSQSVLRTPSATSGSTCLRGAAGITGHAELTYFEVGSFEGTPAFIGAFRTGTGSSGRLLVVAATRDGCRALDVIHERL